MARCSRGLRAPYGLSARRGEPARVARGLEARVARDERLVLARRAPRRRSGRRARRPARAGARSASRTRVAMTRRFWWRFFHHGSGKWRRRARTTPSGRETRQRVLRVLGEDARARRRARAWRAARRRWRPTCVGPRARRGAPRGAASARSNEEAAAPGADLELEPLARRRASAASTRSPSGRRGASAYGRAAGRAASAEIGRRVATRAVRISPTRSTIQLVRPRLTRSRVSPTVPRVTRDRVSGARSEARLFAAARSRPASRPGVSRSPAVHAKVGHPGGRSTTRTSISSTRAPSPRDIRFASSRRAD